MIYLGLFLLSSVMWLLINLAYVEQAYLYAVKAGKEARGTSLAPFFIMPLLCTIFAIVGNLNSSPYGLWIVFSLHALCSLGALFYIACVRISVRKYNQTKKF